MNLIILYVILFKKEKSQKNKPKQEATVVNITSIQHFPTALIGYLASFLDQYNYIQFSSSNRSIYLGCNSPKTLQELNLRNVSDYNYSCVKWTAFPLIRRLNINIWRALELQPFETPVFCHLNTLTLNVEHIPNVKCMTAFFNRNIFNCSTVTSLRCVRLKSGFVTLLKRFPNLQNLELCNVSVADNVTARDIANICPDITGLYLFRGDHTLNLNLIGIFANKLERFAFCESRNEITLDQYMFDKLEELRVPMPRTNTLDNIVKSASNLKKIYLAFAVSTNGIIRDGLVNNVDIKNMLAKLIQKCSLLKYMCFRTTASHLYAILEGIECGLFVTKKRKQKDIIINIEILEMKELTAKECALPIGRVINSLESSHICNFMFVLILFGTTIKKNGGSSQEIYEELRNVSMHTQVILERNRIIISNQHCTINGSQNTVSRMYY